MRKLLFIFCLAAMSAYADPSLEGLLLQTARTNAPLLLQAVPNAFAAWSVRQLNASYAGSCMVVQRSSDGASNSYGFVNGVVDTNSILSFCGSGNGYVIRWCEQSGNGLDGLVWNGITNGAPCIVVSGALIVGSNNLPALRYRGAQGFLTVNQTISGSVTIYAVAARPWTSAVYAPIIEWNYGNLSGIGFVTSGGAAFDWSAKQWLAVGNGYINTHTPRALGSYGAIADNTWHLIDTKLTASGSGIWMDNVSIATTVTDAAIAALTSSPILIGSNGGDDWDRDMSEIVIYNAAHTSGQQSTARANIDAAYLLY